MVVPPWPVARASGLPVRRRGPMCSACGRAVAPSSAVPTVCCWTIRLSSVLLDDSALTVRAAELGLAPELAAQVAQRQPLRVLVDGRLRVPLDRRLFHEPGPVLVVCADAMGREAEYQ